MANLIGRPPKYTNSEEIQDKIDKYFQDCKGEMLKDDDGNVIFDKYGQPVILHAVPPTITGLALALGFATRKSLLEYQGKAEFVNTITRAKSLIEKYTEERLFDRDGVQGAKFSLINNFKDWSEKQDIGISGEVVKIIDDIPRGENG